MRFRRTRRGLETSLDPVEAEVLSRCAQDLLVLLGDAAGGGEGADPLEALVGLSPGEVEPPRDPALARLLPDAYGDDDPGASRDFRRYTEADLRRGKREACRALLASLPDGGGKVVLDRPGADAWLGCLNDVRLVLGTRLDVTEDLDPDTLDPSDARLPALQVYGWLGWVQESLLGALLGRG